jgi:hypothetical protein
LLEGEPTLIQEWELWQPLALLHWKPALIQPLALLEVEPTLLQEWELLIVGSGSGSCCPR